MRGELLQTQCDALLLVVEVEDHDLDLLVERHDLLGMVHAAPREVGDVDQTVHTAQVDEYAVGGDVLDGTLEDLTLLELRHDDLLLSLELGLDQGLVRNDHVAELLVDLDDLELHGLVDVYVVVADGLHVDLRAGQEGLDAEDVDDHAALRAALDVTLDDLVLLEGLVDAVPRLELTSLLVREGQLAVLVLGRLDIDLDLVADLQVGVVAELRYGNDTLALVADVDENLALGDGRDGTLDHLADGDVRQRLVIGCRDLLPGLVVDAQVVLKCVPVEILVRDYILCFFHVEIFAIQSLVKWLIIKFLSTPCARYARTRDCKANPFSPNFKISARFHCCRTTRCRGRLSGITGDSSSSSSTSTSATFVSVISPSANSSPL